MNAPAGHTAVELTVSLDGYATGAGVDVDHPFGHSGQQLHAWHESSDPVDAAAAAAMMRGTGAFILGRTTFDVGIGTWGRDGAFGTHCFVLTSRPHEPVHRGPTTFTFITDGIDAALALARGHAQDQTVVVMGGPSTAQQALRTGTIDELRLHIRPILLGAGTRLLDDLPTPSPVLRCTRATSTPNATHLTLTINGRLCR
jgi:dihydrofolate reductase